LALTPRRAGAAVPGGSSSAVIGGILLAGGAGSRFGGRKLLYPLPDGTPIGVAAWRNLRAALAGSVAVVRAGDDELATLFAGAGAPVVRCEDAHLGMGHSLACGVRALEHAGGWVVALADMPRVHPQTIAAVAERLRAGARIALPVWNGRRGHPVGFAAACRDELLALSGDSGARALLERHAAEVVRVPVDDPGIVEDVDTPADAERLNNR
jgi:molybdenum cofactor cytidylyltransferase